MSGNEELKPFDVEVLCAFSLAEDPAVTVGGLSLYLEASRRRALNGIDDQQIGDTPTSYTDDEEAPQSVTPLIPFSDIYASLRRLLASGDVAIAEPLDGSDRAGHPSVVMGIDGQSGVLEVLGETRFRITWLDRINE